MKPYSLPTSRSDLAVEPALVCACVVWPLGEDHLAQIAHLAARVGDWAYVQRLAFRHRICGMVCHALLQAARDGMPGEMTAWCERQVEIAGLHELAACADAQRTVALLARASIPARVLKGPAVSIIAYGRLGLRTNRDVDILVDPGHCIEAAALLEAEGWQRVEPRADASAASLAAWMRNHKDFTFVRPDGRMQEIHWRLFNNKGLLVGLERCPIDVVHLDVFALPTLRAAENLLYLCVHGAEHCWSRLKWVADTAAIMRRLDAAGFEHLLQEAKRRGVFPAVAQAMLIAADFLSLALPSPIERRLRRSLRAQLLKRVAVNALFGGGDQELEDRRWSATLKNITHYAMADGARFWWEELRFDLTDLSAAHLPESYQRFGPFARGVALVTRQGQGRH